MKAAAEIKQKQIDVNWLTYNDEVKKELFPLFKEMFFPDKYKEHGSIQTTLNTIAKVITKLDDVNYVFTLSSLQDSNNSYAVMGNTRYLLHDIDYSPTFLDLCLKAQLWPVADAIINHPKFDTSSISAHTIQEAALDLDFLNYIASVLDKAGRHADIDVCRKSVNDILDLEKILIFKSSQAFQNTLKKLQEDKYALLRDDAIDKRIHKLITTSDKSHSMEGAGIDTKSFFLKHAEQLRTLYKQDYFWKLFTDINSDEYGYFQRALKEPETLAKMRNAAEKYLQIKPDQQQILTEAIFREIHANLAPSGLLEKVYSNAGEYKKCSNSFGGLAQDDESIEYALGVSKKIQLFQSLNKDSIATEDSSVPHTSINPYVIKQAKDILFRHSDSTTKMFECKHYNNKIIGDLISNLIEAYYDSVKICSSREEKLQAIAELRTFLVWMHPFTDGNARVGKLLLNLLLLEQGETPVIFPDAQEFFEAIPPKLVDLLKKAQEDYKNFIEYAKSGRYEEEKATIVDNILSIKSVKEKYVSNIDKDTVDNTSLVAAGGAQYCGTKFDELPQEQKQFLIDTAHSRLKQGKGLPIEFLTELQKYSSEYKQTEPLLREKFSELGQYYASLKDKTPAEGLLADVAIDNCLDQLIDNIISELSGQAAEECSQ